MQNCCRRHRKLPSGLTLALVLLCTLPMAAADEAGNNEPDDKDEPWLDSSYSYLNTRADAFASWVDSFFGHPRDVVDEPKSIVRIRPQFEWDEEDDTDWKLRATGKLHLPSANDRLSLVFSSKEGDFDDEIFDPAIGSGQDSSAGLQYQVRRKKRSAAYLFAGVKAGPNVKIGARYRFQDALGDNARYRVSEEVFYVGGDGFTSLTRLDIDRVLTNKRLLRWANRVEYGEETEGAEWKTQLSYIRRYDKRTAWRTFAFIRGDTDPQLLKTRGFGLGVRRRFLRDWLYWEIEPRYEWRKRREFEEREGVASVRLRFEAVIGDF